MVRGRAVSVELDVPAHGVGDRPFWIFASSGLASFVLLLVLQLEWVIMTEPIFDHENLDMYRLSIEYVAASYHIAKGLTGANRHLRDQWLRAAQSTPLNFAEGNGKQSRKDKSRFFEIARGSALKCAAIHDLLKAVAAVEEELNRQGKMQLRRIVSMLTRLIRQIDCVVSDPVEYKCECEYEYRDAEYE